MSSEAERDVLRAYMTAYEAGDWEAMPGHALFPAFDLPAVLP